MYEPAFWVAFETVVLAVIFTRFAAFTAIGKKAARPTIRNNFV